MLSYSTQGLPDWSFEDLSLLISRFGYEGMEIALTPEHISRKGDPDFWRAAKEAAERAGVTIVGLHLGNPRLYDDPNAPRLLHPNASARQFHVALAHAALQISEHLGLQPRVSAASGSVPQGMTRSDAWELMVEGVERIVIRCKPPCEFLIEHEPEHFIRTSDDLLELHERADGRVFATVDVGHLEVAGEPIGPSIEKVGRIIRAMHLEDIKGRVHRHLLPGMGDIDFEEIGAAIRRANYRGPLIADLYPYVESPIIALKAAYEAFAPLVP